MKTSSILDTYQTWLTHRVQPRHHPVHQSPGPLFADTGAGDIPTRETVAAWRIA